MWATDGSHQSTGGFDMALTPSVISWKRHQLVREFTCRRERERERALEGGGGSRQVIGNAIAAEKHIGKGASLFQTCRSSKHSSNICPIGSPLISPCSCPALSLLLIPAERLRAGPVAPLLLNCPNILSTASEDLDKVRPACREQSTSCSSHLIGPYMMSC